MTIDKDSDITEPVGQDSGEATHEGVARSAEEISIWLVGMVVLFLILIFVVTGLIVHRVYFQPQVARTAIERDMLKFKEAINKDPNDADAYIGLADVYLEMQDPQSAINMLDKAVKLNPKSWNAHFEMGRAYDAQNKTSKAIDQFTQATMTDPYNELAFYQLGRLYQKQKSYGQAIQAYQRALKINPTLADAHYYLGYCYEKTNEIELAKSEYHETLKYVPDYVDAKEALKRLE